MGHYTRATQAGLPRHSKATAGEPLEPETGKKAGKIETMFFGIRTDRVRFQNRHFSRPDPLPVHPFGASSAPLFANVVLVR
jgi:hypothetical protein